MTMLPWMIDYRKHCKISC